MMKIGKLVPEISSAKNRKQPSFKKRWMLMAGNLKSKRVSEWLTWVIESLNWMNEEYVNFGVQWACKTCIWLPSSACRHTGMRYYLPLRHTPDVRDLNLNIIIFTERLIHPNTHIRQITILQYSPHRYTEIFKKLYSSTRRYVGEPMDIGRVRGTRITPL